MAVLTENIPVRGDLMRQVDNFAQEAERTREDVVDEAIERYLLRQEYERVCADMRDWVKQTGFTQEDLAEEIRLYREEQRSR